ncbi:hypothetical protein M2396_000901 [Pseudomonas sp. BIGb0278]|uniref:DUF3203 family protein n=1 Tax=Pseudomonas TaxID=286 RepID=UPI000C6ED2D5|nr:MULTISPECIES: DUF3203 family protein [Pseudomonas]AUF96551.1 DUF3203 domain-containing protein [Pseudomonas sp. 02C 26]MBA1198654.1 DUF3203 family protein [Pseudomonas plecoglossicida]MCS4282636.1 hypothetical protein [Pseudomonas sp. BIGb0278]QYX54185.1 DUF3203 family protein [Pseudomonas sp. S07E 245]VVM77081.1 hypothetical protein PS623_02063 [Pseudomonas fluorescens]
MPIEVDQNSRHCTLISDKLRIEGTGPEVEIVTDEQLRMSVAVLAGERIPITEAEADALTVIGAVDSRRHLKASEPGSVI